MAEEEFPTSSIYVLAGPNGAGKSSIAGAQLRERGADYYNPDEETRRLLRRNPGLALPKAQSLAWHRGREGLERAIEERKNYAFETTLGGHTIPALVEQAADEGHQVRVWYVGLESPELHIERVRARVQRGGHDIPDRKIRDRFHTSRVNLIRLMPKLRELFVYDNSEEADPAEGVRPIPLQVFHMRDGRIVEFCGAERVPGWAKPLVVAAFELGEPD